MPKNMYHFLILLNVYYEPIFMTCAAQDRHDFRTHANRSDCKYRARWTMLVWVPFGKPYLNGRTVTENVVDVMNMVDILSK